MEYWLCALGVARLSKDNFRQEQKVSVNLTVIALSTGRNKAGRNPLRRIAETLSLVGALESKRMGKFQGRRCS